MSRFRHRIAVVALLLAPVMALGGGVIPAQPVSAAAAVTLSRYRAAPGDEVTVHGAGFRAGDAAVASGTFTTQKGTQVVQTVTTVAGNGTFAATFATPTNAIAGTATITAQDFHGNTAAQHLTVIPNIFLQANAKPPTTYVEANTPFYVSGAGFQPGETVAIRATFPLYNGNSVLVSKDVQADSNGQFHEVLLFAPSDAKQGGIVISAGGKTSKKLSNGRIIVFYRPTITPGSGFVAPGAGLVVHGSGFAPDAQVNVSLTVSRVGQANETITRTVSTDGHGNFVTTLFIPSTAKTGTFTVTATGQTTGRKASAKFTVSVHPTVSLKPGSVLPGEPVDVSGGGFGSRVGIRVFATFRLQGGGTRTESVNTVSDNAGGFTARLSVPSNAAAGRTSVYARSANGQKGAFLTVRARPAPTATPVPTQAPTATPVPTQVPTSTAIPPKKHRPFAFRYVSIWYHTVRQGTWDYLDVQASPRTTLGIWVHVWFPSGFHHDYYQNTDAHARWQMKFSVPAGTKIATNHHVLVTIRLWHGGKSIKEFVGFNLA